MLDRLVVLSGYATSATCVAWMRTTLGHFGLVNCTSQPRPSRAYSWDAALEFEARLLQYAHGRGFSSVPPASLMASPAFLFRNGRAYKEGVSKATYLIIYPLGAHNVVL